VPAADLTGKKVEDYEVVARLGGGGMGVVYEAKGPDGKRVAIKTLKSAFAGDEEIVGRFLSEAKALKAISHKALVEIFSIGQLDDGTHYFIMEFLEGKTFEDVIAHGAPLDSQEVLPWLCEILDALEAVHAHGVIHRDLKPSNLFLARTGVGPQVKIIDFGVAKHTGKSQGHHQTAVSAIVGTPDYMSPEQVSGEKVTAASDLYALGCVMFEMLTGELPFEDDSEVKKMMMHIEKPPPAPSDRVPAVPKAVDEVVAWMLQKDATKRPPSAIALKRRLETLMGDLGAVGPPRTMQVPAVRPSPPPKVTEPSMPAVAWPHSDSGDDPKTIPNMMKALRPAAATEPAPPQTGKKVPLWAVGVAALLLVGLGVLGSRLVKPMFVHAPDPVPPTEAPAAKPADGTASPTETAQMDPGESDTPAAPAPPPPIRHKRPPVAPPKHKPPPAKDKRHAR
jgi:serine/threonine-protein kinase